ncbi:nucleoid occlusion factor SlmA [Congregibacter litoralis]|uniref:Nucleoid occlusion factor SlmA n=1 Tax=Congregibacter litoralis KT71 TaxID=314285 RepID=A4A9B2_9GAMM|nr:Transcriptional regulator [Congregibacter litoralis KT71]
MPRNVQRRQQILEALAQMLEDNPGDRITTARLAAKVGVSEAALYRHFPSKAKMFEELIQFIEDTLFQRITLILQEEDEAVARCNHILYLLITFAERNPGISRLLTGEALTGETERLRHRVNQVLDRVETQIRQVLREAELREALRPMLPLPEAANLLFSCAEGRISQFVRSEFKRSPSEGWEQQYGFLMGDFFREVPSAGSVAGNRVGDRGTETSSASDEAFNETDTRSSTERGNVGGGFS